MTRRSSQTSHTSASTSSAASASSAAGSPSSAPTSSTTTTTSDITALLEQRIDSSLDAIQRVRTLLPHITNVAEHLWELHNNGGTIYTLGNGGSAAQALHLAEELIGRYRTTRPPIRALCLNADPTALTCIANDFGYDNVFARQCEALLTDRDALVAFSTSGNSRNVIEALIIARERQATSVGLLGRDGGSCLELCDHPLLIEADDSAHIQDAHQVILHLLCEALEQYST